MAQRRTLTPKDVDAVWRLRDQDASQTQIAERTGISQSQVSRILAEDRPAALSDDACPDCGVEGLSLLIGKHEPDCPALAENESAFLWQINHFYDTGCWGCPECESRAFAQ
jgi:transcriptional regulator with XRE-family HTH domain